jgi:hypothetical protein
MIFQTVTFTRITLLKILNNLTLEQLATTPKGFKNNLFWNIAHILVTEQLLTYKLSNLEMQIDKRFVSLYGKGSTPKNRCTQKDIDEIKEQLIPVIKQTEKDYKNGVFKTFTSYPTSVGITLNNIEEALQFNSFHEGIHLGIILSIKKLVI